MGYIVFQVQEVSTPHADTRVEGITVKDIVDLDLDLGLYMDLNLKYDLYIIKSFVFLNVVLFDFKKGIVVEIVVDVVVHDQGVVTDMLEALNVICIMI